MYHSSQSTQLFTNSTLGIQRVYQLLSKDTTGGISVGDIVNNLKNVSSGDLSFVQLLQSDFSKLDTDGNSKLTETEYNKLLETISNQGLSYEQLAALASQSGVSASGDNKSLLQTVMENFNEVDVNHDGKVTKTEIDSYKFNSDKEAIKDELDAAKLKANSSIFYSNDTTSSDEDESLIKKS